MVKLDYARLKNIRLEQDITQKVLATATSVNLSTIKQIETGRSATDLENIEKLCAYLEVDINEIYHPDYHDSKVLCMLNNKGGCGKTSLCSGIATSMAELLDADMLIILTAVEKVAINYNKPDQKGLDDLTPAEAYKYMEENQFAKGSMLPKVQAAVKFAESKAGRTALITLLEKAKDGIEGKTGTRIHQ